MVSSQLIIAAAFICAVALVVGIAMLLRDQSVSKMEDRLNTLTGKKAGEDPFSIAETSKLLSKQFSAKGVLNESLAKWFNLSLLFEQADVAMSMSTFIATSGGLGFAGWMVCTAVGVHPGLAPVVGCGFAALPYFWLTFRRKRRITKFAAQLPEALELVARALRAGHSLAAGFRLVAHEMSAPISTEFNRVFEEQNLGLPFEEALEKLSERIPNLDLKFFVTAVVLQRQTGGDLAEILDKIGHLVRERFQIWGQVQALTGEGRLSGVVLLALPPLLFVTVYRMNPDYLMLLFTDELGKQMLVGGILMQVFGALVIRKIVNIRV
jgi:tight adherence protein B